MMSLEQIKETVSEYYQSLSEMNVEHWFKILDENALIFDPVGKPALNLKEDGPKLFQLLSSFYEKFVITQEKVFIIGNEVAVKWKMDIIAKNGRTANAEGIHTFEFNEDGKIKQLKSYWDEDAMKAQLIG
jgi:ketosteroid isomerase-like protein